MSQLEEKVDRDSGASNVPLRGLRSSKPFLYGSPIISYATFKKHTGGMLTLAYALSPFSGGISVITGGKLTPIEDEEAEA